MTDRKSFFLLLSFKRILSRKIQLHRRRRNLLFFVLKILKSKSLKQNQILLCRFHNFSTPRRLWMINYGQDWFQRLWQNRNQPIYQEFWQREFRPQTETFGYIVNLLRPRIEKQNTFWREVITVEKRIAVTVWSLSTGNSYRTTSKVFGISLSTACKLLVEFCTAVCPLAPKFISFPKNGREIAREKQKFRVSTERLIPQFVGAIDGTHVEFICPDSDSKVDYYSRKQKYTINTEAVVGADLFFLDIATGFSGSVHDAQVLRSTSLSAQAERRDILVSPQELINSPLVRPLILGDGVYPPTTWQVKP